jgi:hypothetical protein
MIVGIPRAVETRIRKDNVTEIPSNKRVLRTNCPIPVTMQVNARRETLLRDISRRRHMGSN